MKNVYFHHRRPPLPPLSYRFFLEEHELLKHKGGFSNNTLLTKHISEYAVLSHGLMPNSAETQMRVIGAPKVLAALCVLHIGLPCACFTLSWLVRASHWAGLCLLHIELACACFTLGCLVRASHWAACL
jgi:hypothetical protein